MKRWKKFKRVIKICLADYDLKVEHKGESDSFQIIQSGKTERKVVIQVTYKYQDSVFYNIYHSF